MNQATGWHISSLNRVRLKLVEDGDSDNASVLPRLVKRGGLATSWTHTRAFLDFL